LLFSFLSKSLLEDYWNFLNSAGKPECYTL
jgi:hypothetical protein